MPEAHEDIEKAHQRINDLDREVYLLKAQTGDIRAALLKMAEKQEAQAVATASLKTDIKYIREKLVERVDKNEERTKDGSNKSALAITVAVINTLALVILELLKVLS